MQKIYTNNRPQIDQLEAELKKAPLGSKYTFDELSVMAGTDVLANRSVIECTKKRLLKHHDLLLVSVRGHGYMLASSQDYVAHAAFYREQASKKVKKSYRITKAVSLDDLDEAQKDTLIREQSKSGALLVMFEAVQGKQLDSVKNPRIPAESAVINLLLGKNN